MSGPLANASETNWLPASLGGGGYITGLVPHPRDPHVIYARCDVAGVFRSTDAGATWRTLNRGMTRCHHHSVQSLAIDPHAPHRLLRASGEAREGRLFGDIHLSEDGGESWTLVCDAADFYGNGPTRQCGEVLAFDPHAAGVVLAGAFSAGLFRSADGGHTWIHLGLRDERFTQIVFHPSTPGLVFAATQSDLEAYGSLETLRHARDYERRPVGALFASCDHGLTWQKIFEGEGFSEIVPHPRTAGLLCAASRTRGLLRSADGGATWEVVTHGLSGIGHLTLTASPQGGDTLFTAANVRPHMTDKPVVAIYRSDDFGQSWNLLSNAPTLRDYPAHLSLRHCGWAIAKVRCDIADPKRLFYSNWYGVFRSDDTGATWSGHNFSGMETTCIECAVSDPATDRFWVCATDHPPYSAPTGGGAFHAQPFLDGAFTLCTAYVAAQARPGFGLLGLGRHHYDPAPACAIAPVIDGAIVPNKDRRWERLYVQALAENPHRPGGFVALLDGTITEGAGLWFTEDYGDTWQPAPSAPWPSHANTLPLQAEWVEAEVLSVVIYQRKNICGTNQLLALDPHRPDAWYVGEPTSGLYATTDAGRTWQSITPPIANHPAALLICVRCHPRSRGVLFAGFLREGLWKSTDFGATWRRIDPHATELFNASALAVGGPDGNTLAVASEPLYWAPDRSRVLLSRDAGQRWADHTPADLGALRWKGLALDSTAQTLLGVTCGNGAFRLMLPDCAK